jgi:hypothetical protein
MVEPEATAGRKTAEHIDIAFVGTVVAIAATITAFDLRFAVAIIIIFAITVAFCR